tara:strand:+ start:3289 stop:4692 length:1404 start_codon:yes stop_codon:yes gene_type:complete
MGTKTNSWIDVDLEGFGQLMASRPKVAILHDLLQNVFDEDATTATVTLEPLPRRGRARLTVTDDCPDGFADLRDAYTLYKASKKKDDPTKRGRFNEGEKFVLSQCDEASIKTTTGTVLFDADGERRSSSTRTESGSTFTGVVRLTNDEVRQVLEDAKHILVPKGFTVTINGESLEAREPKRKTVAALPTIVADEDGVLKNTKRTAWVEIIEPLNGEPSMIYEMGIPVVEVDVPWHLNIGQKVPLNRDRDNVTPAYRSKLLAAVLDQTVDLLDEEDATKSWVKDALPQATPETVREAVTLIYGEGAVIASPHDREADKNAIDHGVNVIHGGAFDKDQWAAIRGADAAESSASEYSLRPDGVVDDAVLAEGPFAEAVREYAQTAIRHLLGHDMKLEIYNDPRIVMGTHNENRITVNLAHMDELHPDLWLDGLLIHECAHDFSGDHLTMTYIQACTRLGAKLHRLEQFDF